MIDYKEVMDDYREILKTYSLVQIIVDIRELEDGELYFDTKDLRENIFLLGGFLPECEIIEALKEFDFKDIDKEGVWDITSLLKYNQSVDFLEGSYAEILMSEAVFVQTFEDRDKQQQEMTDSPHLPF